MSYCEEYAKGNLRVGVEMGVGGHHKNVVTLKGEREGTAREYVTDQESSGCIFKATCGLGGGRFQLERRLGRGQCRR